MTTFYSDHFSSDGVNQTSFDGNEIRTSAGWGGGQMRYIRAAATLPAGLVSGSIARMAQMRITDRVMRLMLTTRGVPFDYPHQSPAFFTTGMYSSDGAASHRGDGAEVDDGLLCDSVAVVGSVPGATQNIGGAAPTTLTTATDHLLSTGDRVFVRHLGNPAVDDQYYAITVLSGTQFSLDGSAGPPANPVNGNIQCIVQRERLDIGYRLDETRTRGSQLAEIAAVRSSLSYTQNSNPESWDVSLTYTGTSFDNEVQVVLEIYYTAED